jgi:TRAP-type C4-dicarboxylate transport system substrate-binding protein
VDYGAHKVHRYHTLTGHCYLSRGIYMNRAEFKRWPKELQQGIQSAAREAVAAQRDLAVEEEEVARRTIVSAGGEVLELTPGERAAFARAVNPLHDEARKRFGDEVFGLLRAG